MCHVQSFAQRSTQGQVPNQLRSWTYWKWAWLCIINTIGSWTTCQSLGVIWSMKGARHTVVLDSRWAVKFAEIWWDIFYHAEFLYIARLILYLLSIYLLVCDNKSRGYPNHFAKLINETCGKISLPTQYEKVMICLWKTIIKKSNC